MPRKARQKKTESALAPSSKSYVSLIYGALTVVIIFLVIFMAIKIFPQKSGQITERSAQTEAPIGKAYEIKEGDTLRSIAEKEYKDSEKWNEIAKANKITNPDRIEKGTRIILPTLSEKPKVAVSSPTPAPSINPSSTLAPTSAPTSVPADTKITGDEYVVVEGDNLWTISVRAYGDGFKWPEIAKANKIPNPDLIYPDQKLTLPR